MGILVNGQWRDEWYDTDATDGRFVRRDSFFRKFVTADGISEYKAERNRYHLYVSLACPWAHRTLILRKLKKLENVITLSIVSPIMLEKGWSFENFPGSIPDTVNKSDYLYQIYLAAKSDYTGRVTVPVLWDRKAGTIVNNESSEIIRMLNSEFNEYGDRGVNFYPDNFRGDIDEINKTVYDNVNNGVYKCGFATTQEAYEEAFDMLFGTLDFLERRLGKHRYLVGNVITEADWRLFTTLIRFDVVYFGHFKCNLRRIADYPNLSNYLRELYQIPGISETVNIDHIKKHYYYSHRTINPTGIVPVGPDIDLSVPHNRDRVFN